MLAPYIPNVGVVIEHTKSSEAKTLLFIGKKYYALQKCLY